MSFSEADAPRGFKAPPTASTHFRKKNLSAVGWNAGPTLLFLLAYLFLRNFVTQQEKRKQQQQQQQQHEKKLGRLLAPPLAHTFVPWEALERQSAAEREATVVTDCTHASVKWNLTHHRQLPQKRLPQALRADTSTGIMLNALKLRHEAVGGEGSSSCSHAEAVKGGEEGETPQKCPQLNQQQQQQQCFVSCNHFDVDGFLAVFCALRPSVALKRASLLEAAAAVGDFREMDLQACCVSSPGSSLGRHAVALCCWLNTAERRKFWRPFEKKKKTEEDKKEELSSDTHDTNKFGFFLRPFVLDAFEDMLADASHPDNNSREQEEEEGHSKERNENVAEGGGGEGVCLKTESGGGGGVSVQDDRRPWRGWREEYDRVRRDAELLVLPLKAETEAEAKSEAEAATKSDGKSEGVAGQRPEAASLVRRYEDLGLVVVGPLPRKLHYYALFGATVGCDVVLTLYSPEAGGDGDGDDTLGGGGGGGRGGRRFRGGGSETGGGRAELEQKYTTFVDLESRPTLPRVNTAPLAQRLNELEEEGWSKRRKEEKAGHPLLVWSTERVVDSGPLLRLEDPAARLTKAERYGHPYERRIPMSDAATNAAIESLVVSFLRAAYTSTSNSTTRSTSSSSTGTVTEARKAWTWTDIREWNESTKVRTRAWRLSWTH